MLTVQPDVPIGNRMRHSSIHLFSGVALLALLFGPLHAMAQPAPAPVRFPA